LSESSSAEFTIHQENQMYNYDVEQDEIGREIESSSIQECISEQVSYDGQFCTDQQWILSDYDTWERNPHYVNSKPWLNVSNEHPESDDSRVILQVIQCQKFSREFTGYNKDSLGLFSGPNSLPF
jgi:hypothetical protein